MIRSVILKASAALACAAVALAFIQPVQAANFSFSDSNCDSFTLTGSPPNQTLTCVVSNAPSGCTIAGPTTGQIGTAITLTANCATGSANAWSWTGGTCQGVTTQSCSANSGSSGPVTYAVTPRNNVGAGNTPSTTVNWSNTPPAAPSGCSLGASTLSLPIGGGTVILTATCSSGGAPTSYSWTGNNLPTPTSTNVASTSIASTTTFSVTPSNITGAGNTATVTVSVAGSSLGPLCAAFPTVLPVTNATWGQSSNSFSTAGGNFGGGDSTVWVMKLTVPAGTPLSTVTGSFSIAEYQGASTFRQLTISTQACDFRTKDYTGTNGPLAVSNGTTASVPYAVATPFIFGPAGLTAGQTYYINARNWQLDPSPQSSCAQTSCNAIMNDTAATP